jgi:hypothetical protein
MIQRTRPTALEERRESIADHRRGHGGETQFGYELLCLLRSADLDTAAGRAYPAPPRPELQRQTALSTAKGGPF